MSKNTDKNLFIVFSIPKLYQQLVTGLANNEAVGEHIIRGIKAAQSFRQVEHVRELSTLLINIPIREFQLIAQYYLVWCDCRELTFDNTALEALVEQTHTYKAKALISRAAFEVYQKNSENAFYFYGEALKANYSISDYIKGLTGIATVKSMEGYHQSALADLESLIPLLSHADPLNYFEVLNSYAVELVANNRLQEARNISRIVQASPFIHAYPEWLETARDLKEPDHSFVAISPAPNPPRNVVPMPVAEHVKSQQISYNQPARVVNLQQWKLKMAKEPSGGTGKESLQDMTEREMFLRAIELFSNSKIPVGKRREMLEAIERILAEPDLPEPGDSSGT